MANLYRVDEMESLIRTVLKEPSQAFLTSAMILQTINDGYKDVALKAFCIEHEDIVETVPGSRLIPFNGYSVNYIEHGIFAGAALTEYADYLIENEITIVSGVYCIPAPTFSIPDGWYYGVQFPLPVTISHVVPGIAIYYTLDGSSPTELSTLYTGLFGIPGFGADPLGTIKVLKAVAYSSGVLGLVATLNIQNGGNELAFVANGQILASSAVAMDDITIAGGNYYSVIKVGEDVLENGELRDITIDSGDLYEVVMAGEDITEPNNGEMKDITIVSGRYWDPIVEL